MNKLPLMCDTCGTAMGWYDPKIINRAKIKSQCGQCDSRMDAMGDKLVIALLERQIAELELTIDELTAVLGDVYEYGNPTTHYAYEKRGKAAFEKAIKLLERLGEE